MRRFVLRVSAGEGGVLVACAEYSDSGSRMFGLAIIHDLLLGEFYRRLPQGDFLCVESGDGFRLHSAPPAYVHVASEVKARLEEKLEKTDSPSLPISPTEGHLSLA